MSIAGDISAELAEEPLRAKIADLEKQRDQLRAVCAEAYQLAGALDAPVEAMDNLSAAANGDPLPHATFLPVAVPDVVEQRDELLAALYLALPFVEDHEGDSGYKPGAVSKAVSTIKAAIAAVEQPAYAPAAEGWIEWNGGECPVAECVLVNVKFANGEEQDALVPAGEWDWSHGNCGGYDIIAYRVVQEGSS